jgi:hypothetical protein
MVQLNRDWILQPKRSLYPMATSFMKLSRILCSPKPTICLFLQSRPNVNTLCVKLHFHHLTTLQIEAFFVYRDRIFYATRYICTGTISNNYEECVELNVAIFQIHELHFLLIFQDYAVWLLEVRTRPFFFLHSTILFKIRAKRIVVFLAGAHRV